MKRTLVIGDVHGCFEELENLLVAARFDQREDSLVFVGDLVDRGPQSGKCVRLARKLGARVVLGNHEEKHLRYRRHEERRRDNPKYKNPVKNFNEDKLNVQSQLSDEDFEFIRSWPLQISLGEYKGREWRVVHGGLEPGLPLDEQEPDHVVRCRWVDKDGLYEPYRHVDGVSVLGRPEGTVYWAEAWKGPCNVIYGHAVHDLQHPRIDENVPGVVTIGIDTGCCFGGRLTALILPQFEFVQVDARRVYWKMPEAWNE